MENRLHMTNEAFEALEYAHKIGKILGDSSGVESITITAGEITFNISSKRKFTFTAGD